MTEQEFQTTVLMSLGGIRADLDNIKDDLENNRTDHGKIYDRLGEVEKCVEGLKIKTGLIATVTGSISGMVSGIVSGLLGGRLGS